jgi:hypothetical protein
MSPAVNQHATGDPFADAAVPSGRGFIALLEAFRATGGTAPGAIVGRLLEEHQAGAAISLAKRIHTGLAFGFAWRGSLWIPMFQFDANDLALKASAQRVRAALPPLWSGWAVASWFAAPNALLGGHCPADRLDLAPEAVLRAARALESGRAFQLPPAPPVHRVATHV